jgi:hypothetical protein
VLRDRSSGAVIVLFSVVSVVVALSISLSLRSVCIAMLTSGSPPLLELGILTTVDGLPLTGRGGICSGRGEPPSQKDRSDGRRAIALR